MKTLYEFSVTTIEGDQRSMADFRGQVLLIVNVASRCGFTPQYSGLERLHRAHAGTGFSVLGFPCDQFGHQEPGDEAQIQQFCALNYDVTFPMFAKIQVNGETAHPLYAHLKREAKGVLGTESIKWNFTKFLVDRQGKVLRRFAPTDTPEKLEADIIAALTS